MDALAIKALNSYPQKEPFEYRTEFVRDANGHLVARPKTQLAPLGGKQMVDMNGVEDIAHTHPYFTRSTVKVLGKGSNHLVTNKLNKDRGPGAVGSGLTFYIIRYPAYF